MREVERGGKTRSGDEGAATGATLLGAGIGGRWSWGGTGSKLKGRRWLLVPSEVVGDCPCRCTSRDDLSGATLCWACSVLVGVGVGPGVRTMGAGNCSRRGDLAVLSNLSKPVLLLPLECFGLEGSPLPAKGFLTGSGAASGSSIGVGGSWAPMREISLVVVCSLKFMGLGDVCACSTLSPSLRIAVARRSPSSFLGLFSAFCLLERM